MSIAWVWQSQTRASVVSRRGSPRRSFLARFLEGSSHFFCALEGTPDIVVIRAAVEREQLEAMRALHLKPVANLLEPLSENPGALRAFDLDLILKHGRAFGRGTQNQVRDKTQ